MKAGVAAFNGGKALVEAFSVIILTSRRFAVSSNRDTESCLAGQSAAFIGVFTGSVTNTFGERLPLTFSIVRLSGWAGLLAGLLAADW